MQARNASRSFTTPVLLVALGGLLGLSGCATPPNIVAAPGGWGKYSGPVIAEWLPERKMRLSEDLHYIEPQGRDWLSPKGAIVDGASIPRPFWSLVGGPFEGGYRDASVIHDVACDERTARWQDVHTMFYKAMRCSGVPERKAKILFAAVWYYGPKWPAPKKSLFAMIRPATVTPPPPSPEKARAIAEWVKDENPSQTQITGLPENPPAQ